MKAGYNYTPDEVQEFYNILREHGAIGAKNGLRARTLIPILRVQDKTSMDFRAGVSRKLRALVQAAPAFGLPIVADNVNGYYIAETDAELENVIGMLSLYVSAHRKRIRLLKRLVANGVTGAVLVS
jgi:hypothetical protein